MRTYRKYPRDASFFSLSLYERLMVRDLCAVARRLDMRHALPATSGNLSVRTKEGGFLVTVSGIHKRALNASHFIRVNASGAPLCLAVKAKPSDETALHALVYRHVPTAQAVIHCHAPPFERVVLQNAESVESETTGLFRLAGHELLKALGLSSHEDDFFLPVIKNGQNMQNLARSLEQRFLATSQDSFLCAFVLEHHGVYCFGNSVAQAEARLEALLYLVGKGE